MPGHARGIKYAQALVCILVYILRAKLGNECLGTCSKTYLEVKHTRIVIVLPREQRRREIRRVRVRERMRVGIPTPETEIEAADTRTVVIHHDDLLVMRPEFDVV